MAHFTHSQLSFAFHNSVPIQSAVNAVHWTSNQAFSSLLKIPTQAAHQRASIQA